MLGRFRKILINSEKTLMVPVFGRALKMSGMILYGQLCLYYIKIGAPMPWLLSA